MPRRLLVFFALGVALLLLKQLFAFARPRELMVRVSANATPAEIERAIDEAVLVEEALRVTPIARDPVVRTHLLSAVLPLRRDTGEVDDQTLLDEAIALGLHRADPVVRQRLIFQLEQLLAAPLPAVDEDELAAYFAAHTARYARPAQLSFDQVFVSRARHGAALQRDAEELLVRLRREQSDGASAHQLGDPTLLPRTLDGVPEAALDARFGPGFAAALAGCERARWCGPIASSYGLHLVWLRSESAAQTPTLSEVRAAVVADYDEIRRRAALRAQTARLREGYEIEIAREP